MIIKEHNGPSEGEVDVGRIKDLGINALLRAHDVHNSLGERGLEQVSVNQFRNTLRGDYETEQAVLGLLVENALPIVVYSEENGVVRIDEEQKFLGVLDGIDGTASYIEELGVGRYATMFGVFSGTDPKYRDYLFSGSLEHSTGRLFYAVKGGGAFVIQDGITTPINSSDQQILDPEATRIYADTYFDKAFKLSVIGDLVKKFPGFDIKSETSSAAHYDSLALGEAEAVIECTRKGNLEIATAYGLIAESGGEMVTLDGQSLGDQKFLEFGQEDHVPVIAAANVYIADRIVGHIDKTKSS